MIEGRKKLFMMIIGFAYLITATLAQMTDIIKLPGLQIPKNPNVKVLEIDNIYDYLWATFYVSLFYFFTFFCFGGILQYTNPIPKTPERMMYMKKQIRLGVIALLWLIFFTTFWLWKIDPLTPYHAYYATHDLGLKEILMNIVVYLFVFDFWFYITHVALHFPIVMKYVHKYHHEFREPTAFGQDAVHPIEAIVQGPLGHFMCTFFYPMNPVVMSVLGFLSSIYALCAHDGRWWDLNNHIYHHYYSDVNFTLYYPLWDIVFGTRYSKQKNGVYKPSWLKINDKLKLK